MEPALILDERAIHVRVQLQFLWHYRLRGDRRRSFGTALTSPEWERYFETL
eukprot:COSAG01_NODE_73387_length_246_cov_46.244898_1_plen_50_part_10